MLVENDTAVQIRPEHILFDEVGGAIEMNTSCWPEMSAKSPCCRGSCDTNILKMIM